MSSLPVLSRTNRMKRLMFARSTRSLPGSQIGLFICMAAWLDIGSGTPSHCATRRRRRPIIREWAARGPAAAATPHSPEQLEQLRARHRAVLRLAAAPVFERTGRESAFADDDPVRDADQLDV